MTKGKIEMKKLICLLFRHRWFLYDAYPDGVFKTRWSTYHYLCTRCRETKTERREDEGLRV